MSHFELFLVRCLFSMLTVFIHSLAVIYTICSYALAYLLHIILKCFGLDSKAKMHQIRFLASVHLSVR